MLNLSGHLQPRLRKAKPQTWRVLGTLRTAVHSPAQGGSSFQQGTQGPHRPPASRGTREDHRTPRGADETLEKLGFLKSGPRGTGEREQASGAQGALYPRWRPGLLGRRRPGAQRLFWSSSPRPVPPPPPRKGTRGALSPGRSSERTRPPRRLEPEPCGHRTPAAAHPPRWPASARRPPPVGRPPARPRRRRRHLRHRRSGRGRAPGALPVSSGIP